MQSGKAASIPAALAAGLITTDSSRSQNCFDYPAISVVSPFRGDKGLFLPLLRLLCSCSLNISISGHTACKHDFLTPPSLPLADFWLDSRVRSRRKREGALFAWTLEIPHLTDHHGCGMFFPFSAAERGHTREPAHFLPPTPGCRRYRDTPASFGNKSTPFPFTYAERSPSRGSVQRQAGSGGGAQTDANPWKAAGGAPQAVQG